MNKHIEAPLLFAFRVMIHYSNADSLEFTEDISAETWDRIFFRWWLKTSADAIIKFWIQLAEELNNIIHLSAETFQQDAFLWLFVDVSFRIQ